MNGRTAQTELAAHDMLAPPWPGELDGPLFVRRAEGAGSEPALFVHGLGGASTNWTDLMGLLRDQVDAQAVDLPGFGHSPPPASGSYRVGAHAKAVVELLERQGRGPVHLFGNSLGGAVSVRVAARRPDLVRTLTLVSPALPDLRPRRGLDPRLPLMLVPGLSSLLSSRMAAQPPQERAEAVLRLCYGDPSRIAPQRLAEAAAEVARRTALPHTTDAFLQSLRGLVSTHLQRGPGATWQQVAAVTAPVLLIWGDKDRLVDVGVAPRAQRTFRDARLLVLPGIGHVAQMEDPETVARAFLTLRAQVQTGPTPPPAPTGSTSTRRTTA